jgi:hypothetical protein
MPTGSDIGVAPRVGKRLSRTSLNHLHRQVYGARGIGCDVTLRHGGMQIVAKPTATVSKMPFGLRRVDAATRVVIVRAGTIVLGSGYYDVGETEVTVAGGTLEAPTWGVLEYNLATRTGRVLPATTVDRPVHSLGDTPIARRPLFRAWLRRDRPVLIDWRFTGEWDLTGWFVP